MPRLADGAGALEVVFGAAEAASGAGCGRELVGHAGKLRLPGDNRCGWMMEALGCPTLMVTEEEVARARQQVLLDCRPRRVGSAGTVFRAPPEDIRLAIAQLVSEGLLVALEYDVGGVRKIAVRLTHLGLQRLKP